MSHIHTQPGQHDITASAYIVRLDSVEPKLMLHKHRSLNKYLQFGGHVELHENPWDAITHELAEESGYDIGTLNLLQPTIRLTKLDGVMLHPYPVVMETLKYGDQYHYHTDIGFAFTADKPPTGQINADESQKSVLFSAQELTKLPAAEIPEDVRHIGLFVLQDCLQNWQSVKVSAVGK